jgi:arginyl-tRNA synthetase
LDIKQYVTDKIKNALGSLGFPESSVILERPKDSSHGDISCNAAMMYAKSLAENEGFCSYNWACTAG